MEIKIGIIGSGLVAQTLGNGFVKYGHEVMLGSRDTSKLDTWLSGTNHKGKTGSFQDAANFGEILVIAVKGTVVEEVLQGLRPESLQGKTIIDATNPISGDPPVNGVLQYFSGLDKSLMEELQGLYPEAHFVKAFNSVGSHLMVNPDFGGIKPTMFICGNNQQAKVEVRDILDKFGWEVEDMGKAEAARAIEPLAMLWCIPGFLNNQWAHAFKLLKSNT